MIQNYYVLLGIPHDTIKPEAIRIAAETRINEFKAVFERLQVCIEQMEEGDAYDYAVLEASPSSSLEDIQNATQQKIAIAKEAYQTLIHPTKRVQYDQALMQESSLNDAPMILRQSTEKHPHSKKTPPLTVPPPMVLRKNIGSSSHWLWFFTSLGLLAIGLFLGLRFL
jgi:hypothetical protein